MKTPYATYRLQFRNGMDFDRAVELVPYLQRLGISHLYASPVFTAAPNSTHGYDVTDHNEIEPALGGRSGLERLIAALKGAGMGLLLDIVPNHMAASLENAWWRDVVEWGRQSPYHRHFDIDWRERLTLPVLGRPYEDVLTAGELSLQLDRRHGGLSLAYFDNLLPLTPSSYGMVLSGLKGELATQIMASAGKASAEQSAAFHKEICRSLADMEQAAELEQELKNLSRDVHVLDAAHGSQPWRLIFWKDARKHLSYRRFFEVTGLVGVRVEEPRIFDDVHRLTLELVKSGLVDGLRIDHIDGLADPAAYLERLRLEGGPDMLLVVEKILARNENLPANWPVAGTTGYEFIASMADISVDRKGLAGLDEVYALHSARQNFPEEIRAAKRLMVSDNFQTELTALVGVAQSAAGVMAAAPGAEAIRAALIELVAAFPVYRTYGTDDGLPERDRELLARVMADARRSSSQDLAEPLAFIQRLLEGAVPVPGLAAAASFRRRFQQLTGPVTAKAVEDTVFYRCNRLIAVNEVGCDPANVAGSLEETHRRLSMPEQFPPGGLLATATHDTKRGEDARARLYAVSEAPEVWAKAVARWRGMHAREVKHLPDGPAPEPDTEWLLYQSLAGIWPIGDEALRPRELGELSRRFVVFVEKALREAKLRTDWANVNEAYESAVKQYATKLLASDNSGFLSDFAATLQPFIRAGVLNSLAQTLVKMTAPGIPDFYQGAESWDLSLVDPDNRRSVDFPALDRQLFEAQSRPLASSSLEASKQALVNTVLTFRARHQELFARGSYVPVEVTGQRNGHLFAFARNLGEQTVIVIVPRLMFAACQNGPFADAAFWGDTEIRRPAGAARTRMTNLFTGSVSTGALSAASVLEQCPVAMLV
ncbi:malto-oligosyltrehalose synthase [Mesorhizobium sp. L103C131B0]|uniref:malto-oligosyltrehalose synthase n=1 Tax=Mesorhizobium sp. L103C131B0 TaxID=1287089 RepID=UPI0003CFC1D8|nr:malto-oligosyltrehalose synthase [Mesorhizobium sp. L103C131B0]ESZ62484.1 malto-oligosyltrehalose synthase [Mesorhizobium sp. L103C131B0]